MMRPLRSLFLAALLLLCAGRAMAVSPQLDFDRLWDYDHPAQTEHEFRKLLSSGEGGDRSYRAQLLTQIARAQGLQAHADAAHKTLDEAEALLGKEPSTARVRCLLERGRLYNDAKKPDMARPHFTKAWDMARSLKEDGYAIDSAHMLGILESGDLALQWDEKALDLAEHSADRRTRGWLGPLYNNIGWTYYDRKEYPRALALLEKARDVFEKGTNRGAIRIARYSVGKALRALGRVEEALALQRSAQVEMEKANEPDGYVYEELGECLLAQKHPDEARPFFVKAYALLSNDKDLVSSEPKRLRRLKELAGG